MKTVTLLMTRDHIICSVWADRETARRQKDAYNADPFIEPGIPDLDAPYYLDTWTLSDENP